MTNTERIQANNAELREAIEMAENLPDAGSGGEDVTEETNEYTEKLEALETAITALENELEGKASGGGGSVEIETYTGEIALDPSTLPLPGIGLSGYLYYTDENLIMQNPSLSGSKSFPFTIAKGSIVITTGSTSSANKNCVKLGGATGFYAYEITGNDFVIFKQ